LNLAAKKHAARNEAMRTAIDTRRTAGPLSRGKDIAAPAGAEEKPFMNGKENQLTA
jgi:hypothetical protein